MQKSFIVHTAVEEDVLIKATNAKGQPIQAKVPGLTVEIVDTDDGRSHSHTFDTDVDEAKELFVPGQLLTLTFARKAGAPTMTGDGDPSKADAHRNEALVDKDKTESQRKDEDHQKAKIKSGVPDPITQPKTK
jgi:hypothetical protein